MIRSAAPGLLVRSGREARERGVELAHLSPGHVAERVPHPVDDVVDDVAMLVEKRSMTPSAPMEGNEVDFVPSPPPSGV